MTTLAEEVQTFIVALGAPWTSSNVFIGEMGDTPDVACGIYEYPGELEHFLGGGPARLETARFQVVTRATGYASARQ
ncbi:MAG: minor capsid protein, partial [Candidatus Nanopelagicales bacterium]|nr:minor capsid protein [Candidatus Nanopelagicales bacterium]